MIRRVKINFSDLAERIERLKDISQRVEGIELIVLFGSLAADEPKPLSDIDVAFQVADLDEKKRIAVWGEVTDALRTDEVDIVFLNDDVAYSLKYEIAQSGRLLYEACPGKFLAFQVLATVMWLDFKPLAEYQHRVFWERVRKEGFGR